MQHFSKNHLPIPVEEMELHRKTTLTPMVRVKGPFTVTTQKGDYTLGDNWEGFLAVDKQGYPYPVSLENYLSSYEVN